MCYGESAGNFLLSCVCFQQHTDSMPSSEKYIVIVDMIRGVKLIAEKLGNISRILRM